jgi:hypothetical protein
MIHTERKLSEARFFLRKLSSVLPKQPDSSYYLSAFLSSSRSILWIMRAEFSKIEGWQEWYSSKTITSRQKVIFDLITELRNRNVKASPIESYSSPIFKFEKQNLTSELREYLKKYGDKKHRFILEKIEPGDYEQTNVEIDRVSIPLKDIKPGLFVSGYSSEEMTNLCKSYIMILSRLVRECVSQFGNPSK